MKFRLAIAALSLSFALSAIWMVLALSWWMLPAALFGWYCADAMSGIVHMYMDYKPCRPGIGLDRLFFYTGSRESAEYIGMRDRTLGQLSIVERLVFDFKNHHPRPDALGRRSILVQIGSTVLYGTLPAALLLNIACFALTPPGWAIAGLLSFLTGSTFAQYFHGSLHRADNPWPVILLRKLGLLMKPQGHERHHATLTCDFSTNTGWSNPLLNLVFRALRARGHMREDGLEPS